MRVLRLKRIIFFKIVKDEYNSFDKLVNYIDDSLFFNNYIKRSALRSQALVTILNKYVIGVKRLVFEGYYNKPVMNILLSRLLNNTPKSGTAILTVDYKYCEVNIINIKYLDSAVAGNRTRFSSLGSSHTTSVLQPQIY